MQSPLLAKPRASPALINALGNVTGFLASSLIGVILQYIGQFSLAKPTLIPLEPIGCAALLNIARHRRRSSYAGAISPT